MGNNVHSGLISNQPTHLRVALTITRPANQSAADHLVVRQITRHGTALRTRPLLCLLGGDHTPVWATSGRLPFADQSIAEIHVADVLEHVRDDEQLIEELCRVLIPGGVLYLTVPNTTLVAGCDALNLTHYLVDVTRRGKRPAQTDEIGWRRHYTVNDLMRLLRPNHFVCTQITSFGTGVAELANFANTTLFRWLTFNENRYRRGKQINTVLARIDRHIPTGQKGFWLAIVAIRLPVGDSAVMNPGVTTNPGPEPGSASMVNTTDATSSAD